MEDKITKQWVINTLQALHRDLGEPKTFEELRGDKYDIKKVIGWVESNSCEPKQSSWTEVDDDIQGKVCNLVCSDNRLCESGRITLLKWLKGLKDRMIG